MKILIFDFYRTLYNPEKEGLEKSSKKVLKTLLKSGFELCLVSQGKEREDLIKKLNLEKYFSKILLSSEKSLEDFKKLVTGEVEKKASFVVGDRVKKEIKFGNLLELKTVWLKKGKFADERPSDPTEEPDFVIEELEEVLKIIKQNFNN